jgi:CubicO group peptidase (beta-lactamase class C family)
MYRLSIIFFIFIPCILIAQTSGKYLLSTRPESMGYPKTFFPALGREAIKQIPSLGSFVVWRHGALIYEGYFNGNTRDSLFFVQSVTKSFVSAIAGAAHMRGYLPTLDTPVLDILPEYARKPPVHNFWNAEDWNDLDTQMRDLTMRHLITMQTGLNYQEFTGGMCHAFIFSSDPARYTLDLAFSEDPGTKFNYCSPGSHLFAVCLARLLNADMFAFADSTIFKPAGITLKKWPVDPQGRYIGFSDLQFTTQDMIRLGLLYLKKGKLNGKQILSEDWIKDSWQPHAKLDHWDVLPGANGYGYFWWRRKTNGHQAYIASGYGGQLICVIPSLDMVIATTCLMNEKNRGREEIKKLHLLMDKVIRVSKKEYRRKVK